MYRALAKGKQEKPLVMNRLEAMKRTAMGRTGVRYLFLLCLLMSTVIPVHGQEAEGSSVTSRTRLSADGSRTWLPVTASPGGGYVSGNTVACLANSQYGSDAAPFSRTEYDGFLRSQPANNLNI